MILDTIAAAVAKRLAEDIQQISRDEMRQMALDAPAAGGFPFEQALKRPGISAICEVKFPYVDIAREYEQAGAAAISVLTERDYFQGSCRYLQEISSAVKTPLLRKDFIIDEYQVDEARRSGASAILLICALLDDEQLAKLFRRADSLGLSALVEAHDEDEVRRAVAVGARIIGVNNRNLKDFSVTLDTSCRLRPLVPKDVLFVAESGIRCRADIDRLREAGADAVLIGETLMRSADKKAALAALTGERHGED